MISNRPRICAHVLIAALLCLTSQVSAQAQQKVEKGEARRLCELLATNPETPIRNEALDKLETLCPELAPHVVKFVLAKPGSVQRHQATCEMGGMGPKAQDALCLLLGEWEFFVGACKSAGGNLEDQQRAFMCGTADMLAKIAPSDRRVADALIKGTMVQEQGALAFEVRSRSLAALATLTPPEGAKYLVPTFVGFLDNPHFRVTAIVALGNFGPDAKESVPVLMKLRFDEDETVRTAVRAALKKIGE